MDTLDIRPATGNSSLELPFADGGVHAGFPSPAQDCMENAIDLNRDLVRHPESTFYARVVGDSMIDADLNEGDILVIDKSLTPRDGCIAVCVLDGEFTVKQLRLYADHVVLQPANEAYPPIRVAEGDRFSVWGIVTYAIKRMPLGGA